MISPSELGLGLASSRTRWRLQPDPGTAAGKPGTTDDTRDAWFVGYTPQFLALVWVGYDDNARTGLTGASGALPIWVDFMRRCGFPGGDQTFPEPEGVVHRVIDPLSGGIATDGCPTTVDEVFVEGTEPEEECPLHGGRHGLRYDRNGPR